MSAQAETNRLISQTTHWSLSLSMIVRCLILITEYIQMVRMIKLFILIIKKVFFFHKLEIGLIIFSFNFLNKLSDN